MVIDIEQVIGEDGNEIVRKVLEIGKEIGKKNWNEVVKEKKVLVKMKVDRKVMDQVMKKNNIKGVKYELMKGEEVIKYMEKKEERSILGGED